MKSVGNESATTDMQIIRKYKKLEWFDFLDVIERELKDIPGKTSYFEILDELRMRLIDSISEGATFKLKAPTRDLVSKFETRTSEDPSFANEDDLKEFIELAGTILE